MTKEEKVIKGLECCDRTQPNCDKCPYESEYRCIDDLWKDVLILTITGMKAKKAFNLRPCIVNGKKGFFHKWASFTAENTLRPVGIVEFEDGTVDFFNIKNIKFTDRSAER